MKEPQTRTRPGKAAASVCGAVKKYVAAQWAHRTELLRRAMRRIEVWHAERDEYFCHGEDEIVATNLRTLVMVCFTAVPLTLLIILVTPLIFHGWHPKTAHLLLLLSLMVFGMLSNVLRARGPLLARDAAFLCHGFTAVIFLFVLWLDILVSPNAPGPFMPVVMMAMPALFTLRFHRMYAELVLFEVLYSAAAFCNKPAAIAGSDCFSSLVALLLSLAVAIIIQSLRAESFSVRRQYKRLSMTDGLTGILNKANCEYAVREYLRTRAATEPCALLILDVDDFKRVNDTMGHKAGDDILSGVGVMLADVFSEGDVLGRFGGDEFLVLMKSARGEQDVARRCARLFSALASLSEHFGYALSCSVGAALLDGGFAPYEQMFGAADTALYEAKAAGKACMRARTVQSPALADTGTKPLVLVADDNALHRALLRTALEADFTITEAADGHAALAQIGRFQGSLSAVVLDLVMPEPDGYEVLRRMKSRAPLSRIPVIVVTADDSSEAEVLAMGAADRIAKPFDAAVVALRVRNAVHGRSRCPIGCSE